MRPDMPHIVSRRATAPGRVLAAATQGLRTRPNGAPPQNADALPLHLVPEPPGATSQLRVAHVISTPVGVGGAEQTLSQLVRYGGTQGWAQLVLNPFSLDPHSLGTRRLYEPATYE